MTLLFQRIFLTAILVGGVTAPYLQAKVSALFHPYDATFVEIAKYLRGAEETIDIAMYNLEATTKSYIIQTLKLPELQNKIQTGQLQIRLIYEGYGTTPDKTRKSDQLENLGIDVRWMATSLKMHHKFAIIDGFTDHSSLITGSANWSLSSRNKYNENILFIENEPEIASQFQEQFNSLWQNAQEFGHSSPLQHRSLAILPPNDILIPYFNSQNFRWVAGKLVKQKNPLFTLTRAIVKAIDHAQNNIKIASTRMKLRPIYDALLRAADRGVKIEALVTMGEYLTRYRRDNLLLPPCPNSYSRECSSGKNFAYFLSKSDFPGHENIDVRIKFFDINLKNYLEKQMHSKYIIIDEET